MIAALQAQIVRGTSSDGPDAGSIRETQVFIGAKHRRVAEARFIPPPPGDQLRAMCERWVAWLTDEDARKNIQLIARIAMAHYQFETLHPFTDGNGRLGQLRPDIVVEQRAPFWATHGAHAARTGFRCTVFLSCLVDAVIPSRGANLRSWSPCHLPTRGIRACVA